MWFFRVWGGIVAFVGVVALYYGYWGVALHVALSATILFTIASLLRRVRMLEERNQTVAREKDPLMEEDAEGLAAIAKAHDDANKREDAERVYRALLWRFPASEEAHVAREKLAELR